MKNILIVEDLDRDMQSVVIGISLQLFPLHYEESKSRYYLESSEKKTGLLPEGEINRYFTTQILYDRAIEKLKNKVTFDHVKSCKDARKKLKTTKPDLVILDGEVLDGKTNVLFPLLKKLNVKTFARSNSFQFLNDAHNAGIVVGFDKTPMSPELFKMVIELCELKS